MRRRPRAGVVVSGIRFAPGAGIPHHVRMQTASPASTPCTRVCTLDRDGVCIGCHRTVDEIVRWRDLDEAERLRLMREVLPLRTPGNRPA